ncbi:uncharacterized protein LOC110266075 [Arachis ipaensis]|uniref:uncharacterized protein LOC110266075 n=1 Tax=Arachis ipaensis TaxID=130454 RepID=UPI000A2B38D8|nr:uncharacterized protein LOC110266075 [Arachis ipaensis]
MTPHEALHDFPMNLPSGYCPVASREILNDELGFYLHQARTRMKKQADQHRCDKEFKKGDWVLLKLKPYRQISLFHKEHPKLGKRFFNHILQRVGKVAYCLDPGAGCSTHSILTSTYGDFREALRLERWKTSGPGPCGLGGLTTGGDNLGGLPLAAVYVSRVGP